MKQHTLNVGVAMLVAKNLNLTPRRLMSAPAEGVVVDQTLVLLLAAR